MFYMRIRSIMVSYATYKKHNKNYIKYIVILTLIFNHHIFPLNSYIFSNSLILQNPNPKKNILNQSQKNLNIVFVIKNTKIFYLSCLSLISLCLKEALKF